MSVKWFKRLTESKEEKKKREFEEISQTKEFRQMLRKEAASLLEESKKAEEERKKEEKREHQRKLKEAEENVTLLGEQMRESSEPFVNVISLGFDKHNGIKVKLDYNEAFIRYLNASGIKAANEEETIRLWLAHLNYDIGQEELAQDYLMNGVPEDAQPSMNYDEMFGSNNDEEESDPRWE